MNPDDTLELMGAFLSEAEEFLQILETQLLHLESAPDAKSATEAIKSLFRAAHSLKGSALMFSQQELSTAAHRLEDSFAILRDRVPDLTQLEGEVTTNLLRGVDLLKGLLAQSGNPSLKLISAEELTFLLEIRQQLEVRFPPPAPATRSEPAPAADDSIVQAIFEYELPGVLEQIGAELEQVSPVSLGITRINLQVLQQQLTGAAGLLQLPALSQISESWQLLLDDAELSTDLLKEQGTILLQSLHQLRQQVLRGEPLTISVQSSTPEPDFFSADESSTDQFAAILDDLTSDPEPEFLQLLPSRAPANSNGAPPQPELPLHATTATPLNPSPTGIRQRPTIRVDLQQLNELINLVGELVINRTNLELQSGYLRTETQSMRQQIRHLQRTGGALRQEYDRLSLPQIQQTHNGFDTLELDHYTEFHSTAQTIIDTSQGINESATRVDSVALKLNGSIDQLQRITQQLRNRVMQLRVVPFSRVVDHLPRALRDLSRQFNKDVNLLLLGRDTKIDESLLEALRDPLLHLIRNAFDHGIESTEERIAAGKPVSGQIEIEACHQGGQTVISVTDDGRGIDPQRIRQQIIDRGFLAPDQATLLSQVELYDFLFQPGFSTASQVTDLSGRGVGLDVVRENLRRVNGSIKVESQPGKGTSFILKLPLMLSIIPALIVEVNQQQLAIPLDAVDEILQVNPQQFQRLGSQTMLHWREEFIQLVPLGELLHHRNFLATDLNAASGVGSPEVPVLILAGGEGMLAIQVDRLWGQQEIVVKPLPQPLGKPFGISGNTIFGAGDVVLILDIDDIFSYISAKAKGLAPQRNSSSTQSVSLEITTHRSPEQAPPQILIVDDAYSVRQLLSRSLSRAYYRVHEAKDGQDALEQLKRGLQCDLIITDLEMPRLDGFGLITALKQDPAWSRIPVTVLTSRTGAKHRSLAEVLGASYYLTKPYREDELLQIVNTLLQNRTSSSVSLTNSAHSEGTLYALNN